MFRHNILNRVSPVSFESPNSLTFSRNGKLTSNLSFPLRVNVFRKCCSHSVFFVTEKFAVCYFFYAPESFPVDCAILEIFKLYHISCESVLSEQEPEITHPNRVFFSKSVYYVQTLFDRCIEFQKIC